MSQLRRLLILSISYVSVDSTANYCGYSLLGTRGYRIVSATLFAWIIYCQSGIKCAKLLKLCHPFLDGIDFRLAAMAINCVCRRLQYHTVVCCSCITDDTNSVRSAAITS